jgi:formylglycine-generating enzyme required for sulfatase activity
MLDAVLSLTLEPGLDLDLVHVPAGEFTMGAENWSDLERPKHKVVLSEFWMGRYLVTVAQYAVFIKNSGYKAGPGQIEYLLGNAAYPVVNVSWYDAMAFCRWMQETVLVEMGRYQASLPTEAEWEKAARGTDGREYPWGNQQPDESLCNCNHKPGVRSPELTPVGHYSPRGDSPYGCADMAGNVWEWTHSLFKPYPYFAGDGREVEQVEGERVVRGGSFYNFSSFMRCSYRTGNDPSRSYTTRGFRVCVIR